MNTKDYIAKVNWQKTNYGHPHEYTVSNWNPDLRHYFEEFVRTIRQKGYTKNYKGRDYICYDLDGYYYWTMGDPMAFTVIINRAVLDA